MLHVLKNTGFKIEKSDPQLSIIVLSVQLEQNKVSQEGASSTKSDDNIPSFFVTLHPPSTQVYGGQNDSPRHHIVLC